MSAVRQLYEFGYENSTCVDGFKINYNCDDVIFYPNVLQNYTKGAMFNFIEQCKYSYFQYADEDTTWCYYWNCSECDLTRFDALKVFYVVGIIYIVVYICISIRYIIHQRDDEKND